MALIGCETKVPRGATIRFSTTFYDYDGVVTQPPGAYVNIEYPLPDGTTDTDLVAMTAPNSPSVAWTAEWDTRNAGVGSVEYSIHSTGSVIPYAVEDGEFILSANPANLLTF